MISLVVALLAAAPATPARPLPDPASLAGLISPDDYPAAALRNEEQGIVAVRLDIGADGLVKGCTVTASSGSAALDSTTCALLRQRARFAPARDRKGRAMPDTYAQKIAWMIAGDSNAEQGLNGAAQAWVDCLLAEAGRHVGESGSADAIADRAFAACPDGERGLLAAMAAAAPQGAPPPKEVPAAIRGAIRETVVKRIVQLRAGTS